MWRLTATIQSKLHSSVVNCVIGDGCANPLPGILNLNFNYCGSENMYYDKFIKITEGLVLSGEMFLERIQSIKDFLEKTKRQDRSTGSIVEKIESGLTRKLSKLSDRTVLFAGGGTDSTYLLLRAAKLNKRFDALSIVTKGNATGLRLIDDICQAIGTTHHRMHENPRDLEGQLELFISQEHRLPRDPVAPLVSLMTKRAKDLGFEECLDGQFADTVFFANPQNILLARTARLPRLSLTRRSFQHLNLQHQSTKIGQLRCYLSLNLPQKLLFLSRVEINKMTERVTSSLLAEHPPQHVLQAIFWFVLLQNRERDKYAVNHVPICSPFDDSDLLSLMCKEEIGLGKRYLRSYIETRIPGAKSRVHSASFRPNGRTHKDKS